MTDEERARILAEALATIERCDREAADLAERQAHNLVGVDHVGERERFERCRPAQPPPERRLDTDLASIIDAKIAAERETMIEIIAEAIALERADYDAKLAKFEARIVGPDVVEALGNDARKLKAEISVLQNCISDLRGTVAAGAQRGGYSPTQRYPRDLN